MGHLYVWELWNCKDAYRWYRTTITVPEAFQTEQIDFVISTGREGEWDATNPQMLLYVNGEIKQGLDVNHRYVVLSDSAKAGEVIDLAILAFGGTDAESIIVESQIAVLDVEVESLYYDLLNPISSARLLKKT